MPSISACIIVRNEERFLPGLLRNLAPLADEIIAVDTGSTDRTIGILESDSKVRLFHFPWIGDFSAARNRSLDEAASDWILVIDADERLKEPLAIRGLLSGQEDAFHLRVRNIQPKGSLTNYEDTHIVRLFRNRPSYRFSGRIHEQISPALYDAGGRIGTSELVIVHGGYQTDQVQGTESRRERNMVLLQAELSGNPDDYYYLFQMGLACKSDQPGRARQLFLQAIEKGGKGMPSHLMEQAHMRIAQLCLQSGKLPAAAAHSQQSLVLNPDNLISRVCLITALVSASSFQKALPHLEFVVRHALDRVPNPQDFRQLHRLCRERTGL
jgi:hypothetical protein